MPDSQHFDLVVLGTGSGNGLPMEIWTDWSIAVVEQGVFGGTCLNAGCIPSKMLVHAADVAETIRTAATFNVAARFERADWPALRDRIFGRIDPIAESGQSYREGLGNVVVLKGRARFTGERTLQVGEETITADRVVVATGTRPRVPPVSGIEDVPYDTSDTIMRIPDLPGRLVVVGGGSIACEMAHVFDALGSQVTMVVRSERLLMTEEPEIGERLTELFRDRGIDVRTGASLTSAAGELGALRLEVDDRSVLETDRVLLAVGRVSNADLLDVSAAGIEVDQDGHVKVDRYLRTSADGVWALGDAADHHLELKHLANADARALAHNLAHPDDLRTPVIPNQPAAVFTSPEIASVGAGESALEARGHAYKVGRMDYSGTAYGWALEDTTSFAKVLVDAETDLILGAHLIGPQASILIQVLVQAMTHGTTATEVARGTVWPHPALSEVIENALLDALN